MSGHVTVFGVGLVGSFIARTLAAKGVQVRAVDISVANLRQLSGQKSNIETVEADASDPTQVARLAHGADVVVGAVPGFLGLKLLETLVDEKKNTVDISFMPEDPSRLHERAKKNGVTLAVDMGLAPGLNNLFTGYACAQARFETGEMVVGGLPQERYWPYDYQLVFSARDVIEEYTRPARYLENGQVVTREALSDVELISFDGVGTLEAFNSDGLRSLLKTSQIPTLKEKTLRYPGHVAKMLALREAGFFSQTPINVQGKSLVPVDVTCEILKQAWRPRGKGHDLVVLEVKLRGKEAKAHLSLRDAYDTQTQTSAMARTTGLPCTALTLALLSDPRILPSGVHPPETFGSNEKVFKTIINTLKDEGVHVSYSIE